MMPILTSKRTTLRPWRAADTEAALAIYGDPEVARWLSPAMDRIDDLSAMRVRLQRWIDEEDHPAGPSGRWAIERQADRRVVGGIVLGYLPPGEVDLEIGWQLAPTEWGQGFASEAGHAVLQWAFGTADIDEVFAVARPGNTRGVATARRLGMEWTGETGKYYNLRLQVYRLRAADFDKPLPGQQ